MQGNETEVFTYSVCTYGGWIIANKDYYTAAKINH